MIFPITVLGVEYPTSDNVAPFEPAPATPTAVPARTKAIAIALMSRI
jgi:hypothetical protein